MLRRASLLLSLAALGIAGVASAGLVAGGPIAATATSLATGIGAPTGAPTAATTASTAAVPSTTPAATTIVFSGHGWGHGMGMAQWGANGYAQHGWSYTQILRHYYPGTTIAPAPARTVRVLLLDGRRKVTLASTAPWRAVDARGKTLRLAAGKLVVPASLVLRGRRLASPVSFRPGGTPLEVEGRAYRGTLLVVSTRKRLQVVDALSLDSYIKGVVGEEMPSTWPAAALEAQAVAARSFALARLQSIVTAGAFDVYADTRSQVYGGIDAESPAVTSAVDATVGQVVLYGGKVATTYFSASSGGRTVSAAEAIGKPVPYLVSVDDPYDVLSPYHDWGPVLMDARAAAKLLGADGSLTDLRPAPGPSGHAEEVTLVGTGGETTVPGTQVRTELGLRSTWFSVGWLSLAAPVGVTYGGAATLTGIARGVGTASLESKLPGGAWAPSAAVKPDGTGAFSVVVTPQATTEYRLAAGDTRAAAVKVPVLPLVQAGLATGSVAGTLRPALAGAACQLQRQSGTTWTAIASSTTDRAGSFAVFAQVRPGSYRVRCAPGHGLSPGVSQPLTVS